MALLQTGSEIAMHLRGMADGAVFMAQSPLALGATVATVLVATTGSARQAMAAAIVFVLAAVANVWTPPILAAGWLVPGVVLLMGALLAAGLRLRGAATWIVVVVGGFAAGLAGGLETATWEESVGGLVLLWLLVLAGLLLGTMIVVPPRLQRGAGTARRMAGAWIAAVGVLLIALWMRSGG